ncbi:MAG: polysaccharide biosynthesis/export family protein [Gemmatimonadaceae bacterium]
MGPRTMLGKLSAVARCSLWVGAVSVAVVLSALQVGAQEGTDRRSYARRADLEAMAAQAERSSDGAQRMEAQALRERLRDGDFQTGDRIVLVVQGEPTLSDSFSVRAGRVLLLPNIPEISLAGVLRSELQEYLTQQIARYVRNPTVRAQPLVRVAIMGSVGRPGFYPIPADIPVSEAIMLAGGPSGSWDPKRSSIRRNGTKIIEGDRMAAAINSGRTLDQLNVRAGDEILVEQRKQFNWGTLLQGAGLVLGLVATIVALGQ